MHGVYAEVLLNYVERAEGDVDEGESKRYLESKLEYDDSIGFLLDDKGAPVMMKWESEIMRASAEVLLPTIGTGRVLNIGFGMGIIDGYLQGRKPESHVIVEAHPAVVQRMKDHGWDKKSGVEVPPNPSQLTYRSFIQDGKMLSNN
jgi:protein arginine N-methyltransferase 2